MIISMRILEGENKNMTDERFKELEAIDDEKAEKIVMRFIPNELGINLISVDDIRVYRQKDGQIKSIHIEFIPHND